MIEIQLTPDPNQEFNIVIDGITYIFSIKYNTRFADIGVWTFTLASKGVDLVVGIPIVGGIDLLEPFNISLKNLYAVNVSGNSLEASISNLGSDIKLLVLTDEEVESLATI